MAHRLDNGRRRFRKLVSASPETLPRLPLIHSTDTFTFEDALGDGAIVPQQCNVFVGDAITYLFYGKPSFRPNLNAEPSGLSHYFPICIIFKPDWSPDVKRVFPFDSGAFQKGLYEHYIHKSMMLGDFSLEPSGTSPGRILSLLFGSNAAYLRGKANAIPTIDPAEFEAQTYIALITSREGNAIDSRGAAVEVQLTVAADISKDISAVILPSSFAEGRTGERLTDLGVDLLPYKTFDRSRPSEYASSITELCLSYYVRLGLIKDGDF